LLRIYPKQGKVRTLPLRMLRDWLDCCVPTLPVRIAVGYPQAAKNLAPAVGFEPTTNRLTADRSTTELRWIALGDAEHTLASSFAQGKRRFGTKESCSRSIPLRNWLRGLDLNQRPSGYEPDELPGCSTPRDENRWDINSLQIEKPSKWDETHLSFASSRLR
jgi:hypothetical protein